MNESHTSLKLQKRAVYLLSLWTILTLDPLLSLSTFESSVTLKPDNREIINEKKKQNQSTLDPSGQ